jgi:hypothetical protein
MDGASVVRRWLPGTNTFHARVDFQHSRQYGLFVMAEDVKGRRAITSSIRTVPARFHYRCSDRQNWLGHVGHYYTGTRLPDGLDIWMPVQGTEEGNGVFPGSPGACMAGRLNFPFTTPDVVLTEVALNDVYVSALSKDVGFDAMPSRASKPSTVYEARVRRYSFTAGKKTPAFPTVIEYEIRLKRDVVMRNSTNVFPAFGFACGTNTCLVRDGQLVVAPFIKGRDLGVPRGTAAAGYLALSDGLRLQGGRFGLTPPTNANGALPAGTVFKARFLVSGSGARPENGVLPALDANPAAWVKAAGVAVTPPYTLTLSRGEAAHERVFPPAFTAQDGGIAGKVTETADLPFLLPLEISGVNPHWPVGVWRKDGSLAYGSTFEGKAWLRLDTSVSSTFYAGNLLLGDSPDLVLEVVKWTKDTIKIEVHNPTDREISATLSTPKEITTHKALQAKVRVPAGTTVYAP